MHINDAKSQFTVRDFGTDLHVRSLPAQFTDHVICHSSRAPTGVEPITRGFEPCEQALFNALRFAAHDRRRLSLNSPRAKNKELAQAFLGVLQQAIESVGTNEPLTASVGMTFLTPSGPRTTDGVLGGFILSEGGAVLHDEEEQSARFPLSFWLPIH